MLAALILCLVRARRLAIVGSAVRKARATSAVDRPHSSRRVSWTWDCGANDGWQQVKIRRRRSSGTGSPSVAGSPFHPGADVRAAALISSEPRVSRRSRSMARLRAVVVIHAPAFGGSPSSGHRRRATANASWTASSARSTSPNIPVRAATDRPDSSRRIRPIAALSLVTASWSAAGRSGRHLGREGAHLDGGPDEGRHLRCPDQRAVQVVGLDEVEASEVILGLGERAVGGHHAVPGGPHHRRGRRVVQPPAEHPRTGRLDLRLQRVDRLGALLDLLLGHPRALGRLAWRRPQHVIRHRSNVPFAGAGSAPALTRSTNAEPSRWTGPTDWSRRGTGYPRSVCAGRL